MTTFFSNVWEFVKKQAFYVVFLSITAVVCIVLGVWMFTDTNQATIEIVHNATVLTTEGTITEYLQGETLDTTGVTLQLEDGRVISEFTTEADLSTAGIKGVSVIYEENGEKHVGKYQIEVFLIRHFDLQSYPKSAYKGRNGFAFDNIKLWAELSTAPKTGRFTTTVEHPDWKTTIVVTNDMYNISVEETAGSSIATAKIQVGVRDISFNFFVLESGFDTTKIQNAKAVLAFTNSDKDSENRLTLILETQEWDGTDSPNGATGYYVYEQRTGETVTYSYYRFKYYIDGWTSYFTSADFGEGVLDAMATDGTTVITQLNGETFYSDTSWRKAIVPMVG